MLDKKLFQLQFLFIILILLFFPSMVFAVGGCSEYGIHAQPTPDGRCECMSGYVWGTDTLGNRKCVDADSKCRDEYGIGSSYDSLQGGCVCDSDYFWGEDSLGNDECVDGMTYCRNKFGLNSTYNSLNGECECSSGYTLGEDYSGEIKCIRKEQDCENKYGTNATYNSLSDSCECRDGYELTREEFTNDLKCVSCTDKYGLHSEYDYSANKCVCEDDYTLKDGECVEKQHNVYFNLKWVKTDEDKAIIESEYNNDLYVVEYGYGCGFYIEDYLNERIVVNLGTDYEVDYRDKIVLPDDEKVCDIKDEERIDSETLNEKINSEQQSTPFSSIPTQNSSHQLEEQTTAEKEIEKITGVNDSIVSRLKGKILLQVEEGGRGWYLNPGDEKKYYLGKPRNAFNIMRELGVGISEDDFQSFDGYAPERLAGRILIRAEKNGEAYYVESKDQEMYFLGKPNDAFQVMRDLGLGVSNEDIRKIGVGEI